MISNLLVRGGNRVLISTSTNVYTNLAFERFLAENVQHQSKCRLLLLWRNEPCVVIGRYQNPYAESDVKYLTENRIDLARRFSGGGTCYHDLGNLNMTIFTKREDYHRPTNLQWLVDTMNNEFQLTLRRTERDDIFLENFKITGSASRLERLYAYHHFTLLINADLNQLRRTLKSNDLTNVISKATPSVRSSVINLSERNSSIDMKKTIDALIKTFHQSNRSLSNEFEYVDPLNFNDKIQKFEDELKSNQFIYKSTPPFVYKISVERQTIEFSISNGIITEVKQNDVNLDETKFVGEEFHLMYDEIQNLKKNLANDIENK